MSVYQYLLNNYFEIFIHVHILAISAKIRFICLVKTLVFGTNKCLVCGIVVFESEVQVSNMVR